MSQTVTVTMTLPVHGSPYDRAAAVALAIYQNCGVGAIAIGELYNDLKPLVGPVLPFVVETRRMD